MARRTTYLLGAVAAAALAQTVSMASPAQAEEHPSGHHFHCLIVEAELPEVTGIGCEPRHFGRIFDFTISGHRGLERFHCAFGFAEDHFIRGERCRPIFF